MKQRLRGESARAQAASPLALEVGRLLSLSFPVRDDGLGRLSGCGDVEGCVPALRCAHSSLGLSRLVLVGLVVVIPLLTARQLLDGYHSGNEFSERLIYLILCFDRPRGHSCYR